MEKKAVPTINLGINKRWRIHRRDADPPGFEPGTTGSEGRCAILAALRVHSLLIVIASYSFVFYDATVLSFLTSL